MKEIPERLKRHLTPADGSAWQQYLQVHRPSQYELVRLLRDNVRLGIKRYAICALFCPAQAIFDGNENVFDLSRRRSERPYGFSSFDSPNHSYFLATEKLSAEILEFSAIAIDVFSEQLRTSPEAFYRSNEVLYFYGINQLHLLNKLPPEKQGFVYKDFLENLKVVHSRGEVNEWDYNGGYWLFRQLLMSREVDQKWKRLTDTYMRELVERSPQQKWGDGTVLRAYTQALVQPGYSAPSDRDLHKEQLLFLFRVGCKHQALIPSSRVRGFLEMFVEANQSVPLAQYIQFLLDDRKEIVLKDQYDLTDWRKVLQAVPSNREDLRVRVEKVITENEPRVARLTQEQARVNQQRASNRQEVLDALK